MLLISENKIFNIFGGKYSRQQRRGRDFALPALSWSHIIRPLNKKLYHGRGDSAKAKNAACGHDTTKIFFMCGLTAHHL
ncbi:MAG: hypothetical protein FWH06_00580 [Oscillospiraceae bacterium]|nr:hypothetical protein [Oscillospiraceae bacterium]